MGFDITKFLVSNASIVGIGFLWYRFNKTVNNAVSDIIMKTVNDINDSDVKPVKTYNEINDPDMVRKRKIREQIRNLFNLGVQVIRDQGKLFKAVIAGEDVQELKNKIIEQIENICSKVEKLEEDCEDFQDLKIKEEIKLIKDYCSNTKERIELKQDLGEGNHLEDEKIC